MALFSCGNEVPINAEWKETIIVYGLLDPADSVQYFRIEKAYLDGKTSALVTAKITDSLILDPASVVLFRADDTNNKIVLQRVWNVKKDSGIFGNDKNALYKTAVPIAADKEYVVEARSLKTGQRVWAQTRTIAPAQITGPVKSNANVFSIGGEFIAFEWLPKANSYNYDVKMEVVYDEFLKTDTSNKVRKTARWNVLSNWFVEPNKIAIARVPRLAFLQFLSSSISADSVTNRRILYANFLYYGGNQTLSDYISVNQPSIGIVQKTAEYTNINGGYGIFASRCFQPIRGVKFSGSSINFLRNNIETYRLHFVP
ncbi:MAG: DUF4249 family protein [Bacteroidia bacterium]|nr:DUF4249 family protein [Bacteroidia bacterium]